jgi:hypothetical protein
VLSASAATADARTSSPKQEINGARVLVLRIEHGRFATGQRARLLATAKHAVRLASSKHACAALAAADAFVNGLGAPTTWRRHRVPRRLIRRPLGLLAASERTLMRRAGGKCARFAAAKPLASHTGGSGSPETKPPNTPPEQGEGENIKIPQGKTIMPKTIGGGSSFNPDPHSLRSPGAIANPFARIASDTLTFFRNSDVGVPPRQASPQEPTAAIAPGSGVVWYTGNTSDALSTNNGRTFTLFNPSNVLPDQGLAFCCDQLVSYSPEYNIFVWVSQYWCNSSCLVPNPQNPQQSICSSAGVYNRIRIAVASPQDLIAHASNPGAAWTYWDVTPATIGQPLNAWFDRSDMSVNPWNFNWGVDIICGNKGNLQGRISLAQLAARGTVTLSYATISGERTVAQGLGTTTTYYTGSDSASEAQIWSWDAFSGTLFRHDINHSSVPINNNQITGSDSGNWYDRYGIFPGEVESTTISGNTLYLAQGTGRDLCTANCSSMNPTLTHVFDHDAIFISKYDVNTWNEVGERWLWNGTYNLGWPALQTDGAGDVGVAFRAAADNHNAQPVAGFLTPSEQFYFADPAGLPYETGDYYSLRPGRTSQSFVMTAQTVQNDPPVNMHWSYIEYGIGQAPYVSPPNVHITAPSNLSSFTQGQSINYSASVSDPIDGTLPAGAVVWTDDGTQIGTGSQISEVANTVGLHTITVTATNGDGKSASDSVNVRVLPPQGPIHVQITSPTDGSFVGYGTYNSSLMEWCRAVQFTASASGGSGTLTYRWSDVRDGVNQGQVSTALSPTLTLCAPNEANVSSEHDLTLTVTDGAHTTQAFITIYVGSYYLG